MMPKKTVTNTAIISTQPLGAWYIDTLSFATQISNLVLEFVWRN